jgi:hypothetical protein
MGDCHMMRSPRRRDTRIGTGMPHSPDRALTVEKLVRDLRTLNDFEKLFVNRLMKPRLHWRLSPR